MSKIKTKGKFSIIVSALMILSAACGQNAPKKVQAEQSEQTAYAEQAEQAGYAEQTGDTLVLTRTCLVDCIMVLQNELGLEVDEIMLYFYDTQVRFEKLGIETVIARTRYLSYMPGNGEKVTIDLKLALKENPWMMLLYKKGTAPIFVDATYNDMDQAISYLGKEAKW